MAVRNAMTASKETNDISRVVTTARIAVSVEMPDSPQLRGSKDIDASPGQAKGAEKGAGKAVQNSCPERNAMPERTQYASPKRCVRDDHCQQQ